LEILPNCPCCIKLSFFLAVTNVLACRHGRWQEYLPLTFVWMVSSCQLSRLKWSLKFTAENLIPKADLEAMICLYPWSRAGPLLKGCSCLVYLSSYFTLLCPLLCLCNIEWWNEACERKWLRIILRHYPSMYLDNVLSQCSYFQFRIQTKDFQKTKHLCYC
jgi:hypothetical protein